MDDRTSSGQYVRHSTGSLSNDHEHNGRKTKEWFRGNKIVVMDWVVQFLDLNPIDNLKRYLKRAMCDGKTKSNQELWEVIHGAWPAIPAERCQRLVDSMPHCCNVVLKNL